jgi:hypothetical protein
MSEVALNYRKSSRWSAEFIDKCLWEVAAAGGNVTRAHQQMQRWAMSQMEETGETPDLPSDRTLRDWVSNSHRNRYHEVQHQKVVEMDEMIAQTGSRLAVQLAEAEERALKQTLGGLASASAVEASQILRNLSLSKKVQVDSSIQLRSQAVGGIDVRGINELAAAIVRAGAGELAGDVVDAEVVEAPSLPAGGPEGSPATT